MQGEGGGVPKVAERIAPLCTAEGRVRFWNSSLGHAASRMPVHQEKKEDRTSFPGLCGFLLFF